MPTQGTAEIGLFCLFSDLQFHFPLLLLPLAVGTENDPSPNVFQLAPGTHAVHPDPHTALRGLYQSTRAAARVGRATILQLSESLWIPHCSSREIICTRLVSWHQPASLVPAPMCRLAHCRNRELGGGGERSGNSPGSITSALTCPGP